MRSTGRLVAIAALATALPLLAGAEPDEAAAESAAAPSAATDAANEAAAPAPDTPRAAPQPPDAPDAQQKIEAYPGVVHKVMAEGMLVRRAGRASDPRAPAYMAFVGKLGVPVEGEGKNSWLALRRGDVVMVSYVTGPPHRVTKVNVLPKGTRGKVADPTLLPNQRRQRSFVGYIKKKEGDELVVMSPRAAPPGRREAEVKAFIRTEDTKVGVLRESWDELRKGDRVRIGHQKGNPRPIDVVQVIRRGGEAPLPPGLATRLFHPDYDESVKDVDGIGETGPVPKPPLRRGTPLRVRPPAQ